MATSGVALHHCRRIALRAAAVRATPIRTWPATLGKTAERLRVWGGTLGAASQIHVVFNWHEELKAKVPAK